MATLTCEYYSIACNRVQTFSAILPVDHQVTGPNAKPYGQAPWRTLYLLHGYSGDHTQWPYNSMISQWAMQYHYAVIMPSGGNSFYLDIAETEEYYGKYIGEELVEVTRQMFPLSRRKEDTIIGGLSMGGFGAIRNGLQYADTFGAVIGLSSALITDEIAAMEPGSRGNHIAPYSFYKHTFGDPKVLLGSDKDPKHLAMQQTKASDMPLLFLACGSEDFLFGQNTDFHTYLDKINYPHEWWVRPGIHDFAFWNQALPAGLDWLEGKL